jgi:hypothetical protein
MNLLPAQTKTNNGQWKADARSSILSRPKFSITSSTAAIKLTVMLMPATMGAQTGPNRCETNHALASVTA